MERIMLHLACVWKPQCSGATAPLRGQVHADMFGIFLHVHCEGLSLDGDASELWVQAPAHHFRIQEFSDLVQARVCPRLWRFLC